MIKKLSLFLACLLLPAFASAEDSLQSVLKRMKANEAVAIAYKEKRSLKMLTEDWHGSGTLYAAPPRTMIKEQQSPEVEIMGIEGNQAYYFQQHNNQRYQTELDEDELHVVAFGDLLHDDLATLQKLYEVNLTSTKGHWTLTLTAKNKNADSGKQPVKIIMQGLPEQPANSVIVIQADGDKSEFSLTPLNKGTAAQTTMEKLLKHLKG